MKKPAYNGDGYAKNGFAGFFVTVKIRHAQKKIHSIYLNN